MKKITFLLLLLTVSFGYAQVVLEDFEGTTPTITLDGGLGSASVEPDPAMGANANVLEIVAAAAGDPWQQANLLMQNNNLDLTVDPIVTVDVYSSSPINILAKVDGGGTPSATDSAHGGTGWEVLAFDFSDPKDNTGAADGQYSIISFFPSWAGDNTGNSTDNSDWFLPVDGTTFYVDNISAVAGDVVAAPVSDPEAAPIPDAPNGETYSIYNDTNGYTTVFPFAYDFGTIGGEPDLDPGAGVNLALKFDFTFSGYGAGEGGPDDVSLYNFVNFNYWAEAGVPGFQFRLISNDGGVTEHIYEIGTNEPVVNGQWVQVSIPMAHFTNLGFSSANFFQWKCDPFMQVITDPGVVYIDNIIMTVNALSVNEFDTAQFSAFPNPAKNDWNISSSISINTILVYDILGKKVMTLSPNATEAVIDVSTLKTGMYFVKMESDNGSKTVKLIKE
ncbi:MAG: hypothetical protein ACJARX_001694 [Psychroserpens sp.]|jgi:hypothetical protein|uniref:T9SS type A sorting domain-containing protein n=1 Tax=Psychroserpens sp. TaxID=2020870 RepID=UPI0039E2B7E2